MKDNKVKNAWEQLEPQPGAQERMYTNILKKAAAQTESPAEEAKAEEPRPAAQKRHSVSAWRRWGSLAACLAVVAAAGFLFPRMTDPGEPDDPPLLAGSPFEDVAGPEGFEKLGFSIDAPENAENLYYCIYDGQIARVDFTLNGHEYTYEAAKLDGNFSRAEGEAVGSAVLNAEYGAVLDRLSPDIWRAHWTCRDVSYYVSSFDGTGEEAMTEVSQTLIAASCQ